MPLRAALANPTLLKQVIDGMKDLCKEVNFDCNETGFQVQCMDSSNVGMVHLMMRESAFTEYQCDEPLTLGLNVEAFAKVLKMCGSNDSVLLMSGGDKLGADKLRLEFTSPDDGRVADFEMKALKIEGDPIGVPEMAADVTVNMPCKELQKAINDLKEFGDGLRVTTSPDGVKFNAEGDIGTGNVLLKPRSGTKPEDTLTIEGKAEIDMSFGMRYINLFTRASSLSHSCEFQLLQGEPFRLKYPLGEIDNGFISFLLAPKLDE